MSVVPVFPAESAMGSFSKTAADMGVDPTVAVQIWTAARKYGSWDINAFSAKQYAEEDIANTELAVRLFSVGPGMTLDEAACLVNLITKRLEVKAAVQEAQAASVAKIVDMANRAKVYKHVAKSDATLSGMVLEVLKSIIYAGRSML